MLKMPAGNLWAARLPRGSVYLFVTYDTFILEAEQWKREMCEL
jgi:hypothetical protein